MGDLCYMNTTSKSYGFTRVCVKCMCVWLKRGFSTAFNALNAHSSTRTFDSVSFLRVQLHCIEENGSIFALASQEIERERGKNERSSRIHKKHKYYSAHSAFLEVEK